MIKSVAGTMGVVVLGVVLGCASGQKESGAPASAATQEGDSGFLRDYARLQETKTGGGAVVRAWASPKLTPDNYNALLIDPLVFYPEPQPSERVSAEVLQQMLAYSNDVLKRTLGKRFKVVDRPGPGVLRIRAAFTSVAAKGEGLKPYQYVPMAFVVTMASRAATGTPQRALIVVEVEGTDSVSGQLMAQRVKVGTGERLKQVGDKEVITLELVKPLLDQLAADALPELGKYVKTR